MGELRDSSSPERHMAAAGWCQQCGVVPCPVADLLAKGEVTCRSTSVARHNAQLAGISTSRLPCLPHQHVTNHPHRFAIKMRFEKCQPP